jgi:hypothetical protein
MVKFGEKRKEKMIQDKGYVRISKTGRNGYGVETQTLNISLPKTTLEYLVSWARSHNVTVSRAIHDMIWMSYHAEKGDYKPYVSGQFEIDH